VIAAVVLAVSLGLVAWVYAGYPLALAALARVRPRPRRREPLVLPVSVIVAANDEEPIIARKVANARASDYPAEALEVIVASNGSTDETVAAAQAAGADVVLDLPERGKLPALVAAVERAAGDLLVFTDADAMLAPETLRELVANFADPEVGAVSGNEVVLERAEDGAVTRGEGLYWRYDQWIKRLEDRVGSTVSASGRLYAVRRERFRPPRLTAGSDDFLISSQVAVDGHRLAFDERAVATTEVRDSGDTELRRKVRVMNQGQRAAFSYGRLLVPGLGGLYGFQLLSHQVLRRFVPFLLLAALAANVWLAASDPRWWLLLAPQLAFYALAAAGWLARRRGWGRTRVLWVPYFFCLANLAAAIAMVTLALGVRFESWKPAR
jgi:cellulose synthase/poly-beta-1,6-N-acetylglucosamine synthase-like glycosyltransferase